MRQNYHDLNKRLDAIKKKMKKHRPLDKVLINTGKTQQYLIRHIYDFTNTPKIIKGLFMNAVFTSQLKFCKNAIVKDPKTQYLCFNNDHKIWVDEITHLDDNNYKIRMEEPRFFSNTTDYFIKPDDMTPKQKIAMKGIITPLRGVRAGLNRIYKLRYKVYKYGGGAVVKKTLFEKNK